MNLATLVDQHAARYGDRVLAIFDDDTVTYAQLAERAGHVAAGLRDLGVTEGDRVAIMMGNRSEFLYAWFGILKLGAIEVPIHDAARGPGHLTHPEHDRGAGGDRGGHRSSATSCPGSATRRASSTWWSSGRRPPTPTAGSRCPTSPISWPTRTRSRRVEVEPHQPASILFTGGTTGPPKGVVLPHNHNINLATSTAEVAGYGEDDVLLSVFPLFHANAKYMTTIAAMVAGAKAIINRRFSASRFWEQCRTEGVTAFNGMGEMLRILMKQPERPDDSENTVRVVDRRRRAARPGPRVREPLRPGDPRRVRPDRDRADHLQPFDQRRAGSMGVPVPWYEVCILDENDVEVPVGEPGEICIRPARPNVMMAGYWDNDSATLKSIRNLWFHTGDHGHRDADDFFFFKARETDSIRRRGENVSAWEVERVLALHRRGARVGRVRRAVADRRAGGDGGDRPQARLDAAPEAFSTSAPTRCRTSRCPGTCASWTRCPSRTRSGSSSRS